MHTLYFQTWNCSSNSFSLCLRVYHYRQLFLKYSFHFKEKFITFALKN